MKFRTRNIFITLLIATAVLGYLNRAGIILQLLPNAVTNVMESDKISDLGDGMHIVLCGAGGPMPSSTRSGPCVAVIANEKMFVVDAGAGGARNLGRMRLNTGSIDGVFLTHFHSDHIDGLGQLAMMRWVTGTHTKPLPVFGPTGVTSVVEGFNLAYGKDAIYRNAHHGDSVAALTGKGMSPVSFEVPKNGTKLTVYEKDGLKVEMFSVNHEPIHPAVGYLFTYKGRTALISGDTTKNENVELFSKNIDLLIHEALSPELLTIMSESAGIAGNASGSKIFYDVLDYHTSPVEVAEIARDAEAKHLLYYHIVPPLDIPGLKTIWLMGVDEVYTDYTVGEDGTLFSLPENSEEIIEIKSIL
ncbi:MAG: MBL fold metallo-hydrolase [Porticoccaceae bacterium]|jgi:ribonuclease Z|nr:MBL fold metallo-hydrolase [Porticoccaceae bacterium]